MSEIKEYAELLNGFVSVCRKIFGENLVGIYLHGSAAMGCFNKAKSDLDLLIVVENDVPDGAKRMFMNSVVVLNESAPAKGIELSVVRRKFCNPFAYPTPFELHFSPTHLQGYMTDPDGYIQKMKGTDKDLAAHFAITRCRGKALYGAQIREVFGEVGRAEYLDSIWYDVKDASKEILVNPLYAALNLCRGLAYAKEGRILSKKEGGEWGKANLPAKYQGMMNEALQAYASAGEMTVDGALAAEYAAYMLAEIAHYR